MIYQPTTIDWNDYEITFHLERYFRTYAKLPAYVAEFLSFIGGYNDHE